ncbi:transketolase-like TK C-terminal-containing protein [Saccharopolyspora pogona]|uniref:transketolase-like TK C-terminal-containing protein n=1 Tax=Saccharopolyspora pogona TaxID=333966 RepID=UPI00168864A8|nr:transketolase C-terminal domain-containing protein [Saccharopolyspora pogona]
MTDLDTLSVNTIRGLCMDAIQKANSGHPGTPMGMAPVAYTLWQRFLRFDPADPIWPNRDRVVLSEGHAAALLWSLLYLTGVRAVDPDYEVLGRPAVAFDDLKSFRQLDSRCPGHPKYRWTSGVETTTGPLGQGVATSAGMAIAGQWLAYWSGFLIFSDYAKAAIRLSALMEIPTVHIFTHDSIGVGEDGPTHQPVEQLAGLRATPGLLVFRPADANEVVETWRVVTALRREPAALILSRQALPTFDRGRLGAASGVARGAYVLADVPSGEPEVILLATGSEVSLALAAHDKLTNEGIASRLVSMPCWELFDRQPREYRDQVLPPAVTVRVTVEQASTLGWDRYVGASGAIVGMHTFGASAPLKQLLTKFGFTPERVSQVARELVARAEEAMT